MPSEENVRIGSTIRVSACVSATQEDGSNIVRLRVRLSGEIMGRPTIFRFRLGALVSDFNDVISRDDAKSGRFPLAFFFCHLD